MTTRTKHEGDVVTCPHGRHTLLDFCLDCTTEAENRSTGELCSHGQHFYCITCYNETGHHPKDKRRETTQVLAMIIGTFAAAASVSADTPTRERALVQALGLLPDLRVALEYQLGDVRAGRVSEPTSKKPHVLRSHIVPCEQGCDALAIFDALLAEAEQRGPSLIPANERRWIIVVEDDLEPFLAGPFLSDGARQEYVKARKRVRGERDGFYRLNLSPTGRPGVVSFGNQEVEP